MDKKNLFNNIEIPDSVNNKINDAYASIQAEEKKKSTFKTIKALTAVAACVAVVILSVGTFNLQKDSGNSENDTVKNTGSSFTIKAYAAELTEGNPFAFKGFGDSGGTGYAVGGTDEKVRIPDVIYADIMPNITVDGENISTITYAVNGATFSVDFIEEESIIKSSVPDANFVGNWYYQGYGEVYDDRIEDKVSCNEEYYSSFTIDYENQNDSRTLVNIVKPYFNEEYCRMAQLYENFMTTKQKVGMFNDIWKDVSLNITVNYMDGTSYTRTLVFEAVEQWNNFGNSSEIDFIKCAGDPTPVLETYIVEGCEDVMYPKEEQVELKYAGNGGIEYNDMIRVEIIRTSPTSDEQENLGQEELWVSMDEERFGNGFIEYENDQISFDNAGRNNFVARLNDIIGTKVGETFCIENTDGYVYYYSVMEIIHIGDEGYDNSKYYAN